MGRILTPALNSSGHDTYSATSLKKPFELSLDSLGSNLFVVLYVKDSV
jgi:hypothetical protein